MGISRDMELKRGKSWRGIEMILRKSQQRPIGADAKLGYLNMPKSSFAKILVASFVALDAAKRSSYDGRKESRSESETRVLSCMACSAVYRIPGRHSVAQFSKACLGIAGK
jgi:hypothetical protein